MNSSNIMEMKFESSSHENPEAEAEVEEIRRFDKSLKELREIRSQLHHAAEHCETTFLQSKEKSDVLENTKEYICRTVVTVVDHLGNVSANLEGLISQINAFSEVELRIQCIKQRVLSCEQYAHEFSITKMRWRENLPRLHSCYLSSPPTVERSSKEKFSDSESQVPSKKEDKHLQETKEDFPLFMYTITPCPAHNLKPTTAAVSRHNNTAQVATERDGLLVLTKAPNPTFQFQSAQRVGRQRRSSHGSEILWRMRRSKRIQ